MSRPVANQRTSQPSPISASGQAPAAGRTYQAAAANAASVTSASGPARRSQLGTSITGRSPNGFCTAMRDTGGVPLTGQRRLADPAQVLEGDVHCRAEACETIQPFEEREDRAGTESPFAKGALLPVFQPLRRQVRIVQHRRA